VLQIPSTINPQRHTNADMLLQIVGIIQGTRVQQDMSRFTNN